MARKTTHWTFADATERGTFDDNGGGVKDRDTCILISDASQWYFDTGSTAWVRLTDSALLFTVGAVKTANYIAVVGDHVRYSTAGGTFPIVMPTVPAPVANDRVGIVEMVGDITTIVIDGDGNDIVAPNGVQAATATADLNRASIIWKFDGVDSVWRIESE